MPIRTGLPLEILERGDPVSGPLRPIPGYTPFRA